jgi:GxxExxY protein
MAKLFLREESYAIVGAGMAVYNYFKNGFLEAVYQDALEIELQKRNIPFISHPTLNVHYYEHILPHTYIPDLTAYDQIIIELKTLKTPISDKERAQLLNYLKISG